MTQNVWAEGQTRYDRTVGVVVITAVMTIVALVVSLLVRLPQRVHALVYIPSFLMLGLMTAVKVDGDSVRTSLPWLVAAPSLLVLYAIVVRQLRGFLPFLSPLRATTFLSQPWWTNLIVLVGGMLLVFAMGNTDRTLHTRLKVERFCLERQWDAALATGFPQYDNDSSLTMLRSLALARTNLLGERLFTYELTGGSNALLPRRDRSVTFLIGTPTVLWRTIGVIPRDFSEPAITFFKREMRRGTLRSVGKDYLLCAYLLDRNLDAFAEALPRYYAVNDSLPAHYAEAYVLYCDKYKVRDTLMSKTLVADYADFLTVMRQHRTPVLRGAALRKAYFGTYWYYYYRMKGEE